MKKQLSVCIDNFGDAVFICRFSGAYVSGSNATTCGATIPGVSASYVMGTSDEAKRAKRDSDRAFHESEANCNTCISLQREPHKKQKSGFLVGRCNNPDKNPMLYAEQKPGVMIFHPDDPMHMSCYRARWAHENH